MAPLVSTKFSQPPFLYLVKIWPDPLYYGHMWMASGQFEVPLEQGRLFVHLLALEARTTEILWEQFQHVGHALSKNNHAQPLPAVPGSCCPPATCWLEALTIRNRLWFFTATFIAQFLTGHRMFTGHVVGLRFHSAQGYSIWIGGCAIRAKRWSQKIWSNWPNLRWIQPIWAVF